MTHTPADPEPLPYDIGVEAYGKRIHYSQNPYPEGDWRHEEWWLGWNSRNESDPDTWDEAADNFSAEYLAGSAPANV